MDIDNILQNIDFAKEEHFIQIKEIINQELQQLIDNNYYIPNIHERLLVSAQQQVMPFICTILDFQSFHEFTDLKNAVNDIIACQKENKALPYPNMQHYEDLCYNTAFIFDTNMEDECTKEEIEKFDLLRDAYYEDTSQTDYETQIITQCFWDPIFNEYYNFLSYFSIENGDKEKEIEICKTLINDILFDIFWTLDNECAHTIENSYFKQATTNLFAIQNTLTY